jgi:hypothetical protein
MMDIISFAVRYRKWIGIGLAVLAVLGALYWLRSAAYDAGYQRANQAWEARQRAAEADARADTLDIIAAQDIIDHRGTEQLAQTKEAEVRYVTEIVEKARDVYRDRPCPSPERLWRPNNQYADELAGIAGLGVRDVRPAGEGDRGSGEPVGGERTPHEGPR